ncbi:hypothetical protein NE236_41665 [Actinoallomurus purpureus]|uniref:hypothetical protein n=1 Tax=Actinoallomurus purpureus TaxID=478114 RepID=UPI0020923E2A|nr:hypothetical protein [Actinoallomurus purpureus]MCO6011478.1 hypothetical protein [Actinoallomurus purpureus]
MQSIAFAPRAAAAVTPEALLHILSSSHPDLWAETLPGETPEKLAARRDAAADILDDLLAEATDLLDEAAEGVAA